MLLLAHRVVGVDHGVLETRVHQVRLAGSRRHRRQRARFERAAGERFDGAQNPFVARLLEPLAHATEPDV